MTIWGAIWEEACLEPLHQYDSASDGRCIDEIFHEASQYDNPKVDYVDQITFSSIQIKFAFEFQGLAGEDLDTTIWAKQRKYCEIFVVAALCAKQRTACLQACQLRPPPSMPGVLKFVRAQQLCSPQPATVWIRR